MLETIDPVEDPVPALLSAAAFAAAEGQDANAIEALQRLTTTPPLREPRTNIAIATQLAVFRSDGFICRYCGKRAILLPALRLLSERYPQHLPYHNAWKYGECHPLYWTHSASCDHVVPVARGGASDRSNLVTSCYLCNSLKSGWLLIELGWRLRPQTRGEWDGLAGVYPRLFAAHSELRRTAGLVVNPDFATWSRLLADGAARPPSPDATSAPLSV